MPLLYEAACCAGIPVIRNLEEYFDTDLLESVEGIVNGSTNYILTATERHKLSYSAALHQAQQLGYAESDPRLDTQGLDARYKLMLLIAHAFGVLTTPERIFCAGIDLLGETELNYAAEKGYKIKLIAHASRSATGEIIAFVMPKFIRSDERFYSVDEVFNGIQTRSCFSDTQFFMGKGAGAYPTASAVLSDLSALTYDYRYEYKKLNGRDELACDAEILLKIFLRCPPRAIQHIVAAFISIEETWRNHTAGYITGILTLRDLRGLVERYPEGISPVLISLPGHQSDHVKDELIEQTAEVMV